LTHFFYPVPFSYKFQHLDFRPNFFLSNILKKKKYEFSSTKILDHP